MNQGEDYSQQDIDPELTYEDEGSENTDSSNGDILGLSKPVFFVGVAIFVIIALLAVLLLTRRSKTPNISNEDIYYPGQSLELNTQNIACYDAVGNMIGYTEGLTDGYSIYDDNFNDIGYVDSAGTALFYDASGNVLGSYSVALSSSGTSTTPIINEVVEEPDPIVMDESTKLLRKLGYTGDEIELARTLGVPDEELIAAAEHLRDAEAKEALDRMSDHASEEFQHIIANSMFCMQPFTFQSYDPNIDTSRMYTGNYTVNADYEKCDTYGVQLLIKVKIANGTYAFYCVTPERWETLPDSGNIVMQVNYSIYGSTNPVMYVTSMEEVSMTNITVNPQDSGAALEQILNDSSSQYNEDNNPDEEEEPVVNWW